MADDAVVGSVSVDVVPSAESFWSDFKTKTQAGAKSAGDDLGDSIASPISDKVSRSVSDGLSKSAPAVKEQGDRQGSAFADAFDKEVTSRLEAALKNLPNAQIDADTSAADGKLLELRDQLAALGNARVDATVDDADALRKLTELQAQLEAISHDPNSTIHMRVDAGAAAAQLAALQAQIDKLGGGPNGPRGPGGGADLGGIGAGASGAASQVSGYLLPALLGVAAVLSGPLLAVGGAAFGTALLGAKSLEAEVVNGLGPAFKALELTAGSALGPGVADGVHELQQALPQLAPLLTVFGTELGDDADKLATWLNNGGIKGFTTYAEEELPIVSGLVNALAEDAVGFFKVTQPLANVLLTTFTDTADAIKEIETLLGKAEDFASAANSGAAKASGTNGSKGSSGFTSAGFVPGQSASTQISGLAQNLSAFNNLTGGPSPVSKPKQKDPFNTINPQVTNLTVPYSAFNSINPQVTGQLDADAKSISALNVAAQSLASHYGQTAADYTAATAQVTASLRAQTVSMQQSNDAAGLFAQALHQVGGNVLGEAQANTAFNQGLLTLNQTLKSNKDSLSDKTAAGLADQAALEAQVAAAQQVYTATAQQTGSTLQAKAAYDQAITSIENATGATGANKQAVDDYIKKIGQIPPVASTTIDINDTVALDKLQDVQTRLLALSGASALAQTAAAASIDQQLGSSSNANRANHAVGGWLVGPGTSTSDSIQLDRYNNGSKDEFLVNAQSAAANAGLLEAINSGASFHAAAQVAGSGSPMKAVIENYTVLDRQVVAKSTNEVNAFFGRL